jgi:hypothetical protein
MRMPKRPSLCNQPSGARKKAISRIRICEAEHLVVRFDQWLGQRWSALYALASAFSSDSAHAGTERPHVEIC